MSPATESSVSVGRAVDWKFAANVGEKLARPGPAATDYTRRQVIEQLADASRRRNFRCAMSPNCTRAARFPRRASSTAPQWIRAATQSMRVMTGGEKPRNRKAFISGRVTGAQTGAVLAFVSAGILGQYDPFGPNGGELLLVYPNVIAVERQLRVQPGDFRLWVCLHEVTHRVQFRANPWLAEHMSRALGVLTEETAERHRRDGGQAVRVRPRPHHRRRRSEFEGHDRVVCAPSSPSRSGSALDQLLVLGTLLEGHADHVMDAVGPAVVPTVATIRRRFDERRHRKQPPLQRLMRAALGFDAKISQYTRGKAFVDHVVSRVGMARFNTIWSGPETLPLPAEIDEPQRWIDRVL